MNDPKSRLHDHQFQPQTIRRLWQGSIVLLAVLVLGDVVYWFLDNDSEQTIHGQGVEVSFGFSAWFGFVSCVGLIVLSKAIGVILKRKDSYYDD